MPAIVVVTVPQQKLLDAIEAYADERWRDGFECARLDDPETWIGVYSDTSARARTAVRALMSLDGHDWPIS